MHLIKIVLIDTAGTRLYANTVRYYGLGAGLMSDIEHLRKEYPTAVRVVIDIALPTT